MGDSHRYTVLVRFIGTLEMNGQELEVCKDCLKKVESISERLKQEKGS